MTPIRRSMMGPSLWTLALLAGCGPSEKETVTVKRPYAERILAAHGVDFQTCFKGVPMAGTPAPNGANAEGGAQDALVAIDSSGSMAGRVGGGATKMDVARAAVRAFVEAAPADSRVGLVVFGHEGANTAAAKAASCAAGAKLAVAPTTDRVVLAGGLAAMTPAGWTPLAAAIQSAAAGLSGGGGPKVVYVVSDGLETCGGDPVAAARAANTGAARVVVNVIAFGAPTAEQAGLRAVASAGGGSFMAAQDEASLRAALRAAGEVSLRDYYARTASTRGQNVVAVGGAVSAATQCVRTSVAAESAAAMAAIDADEAAGRATSEEAAAARSRINNRGGQALSALVAYAEALRSTEQAQAADLWRRYEAAQSELQAER